MSKHNELETVYTGRQLEEKYKVVKDYFSSLPTEVVQRSYNHCKQATLHKNDFRDIVRKACMNILKERGKEC